MGPLPAHKFESKCSAQPAVRTWPLPPLKPPQPLARGDGGAPPAPQGRPSRLLLTGAPLPQSSEMERRLKMGRRRPGSRLGGSRVGDSEPLRLPELREPLR